MSIPSSLCPFLSRTSCNISCVGNLRRFTVPTKSGAAIAAWRAMPSSLHIGREKLGREELGPDFGLAAGGGLA